MHDANNLDFVMPFFCSLSSTSEQRSVLAYERELEQSQSPLKLNLAKCVSVDDWLKTKMQQAYDILVNSIKVGRQDITGRLNYMYDEVTCHG